MESTNVFMTKSFWLPVISTGITWIATKIQPWFELAADDQMAVTVGVMAVVLLGALSQYVGLSTDTKPVTPRAGSTFYETDTGSPEVQVALLTERMRSITSLLIGSAHTVFM